MMIKNNIKNLERKGHKMNKKAIFIILVVAALFALMTQGAFAYTVTTTGNGGHYSGYGPYQTGDGGEFTLLAGDGLETYLQYYVSGKTSNVINNNGQTLSGTFESFCLEKNETISAGITYNAAMNDGAVNGGQGGIRTIINGVTTDMISKGTAWLYYEFAKGILTGYNYTGNSRKDSAEKLQNAIWWLEGELSYSNYDIAHTSNIFINAVNDKFGIATVNNNRTYNAMANNNGVYGVKVLNLTFTEKDKCGHETISYHQDQLVATPIPAAFWLFGAGLVGLVSVRRRLTA
jgi:hypothetical protein